MHHLSLVPMQLVHYSYLWYHFGMTEVGGGSPTQTSATAETWSVARTTSRTRCRTGIISNTSETVR